MEIRPGPEMNQAKGLAMQLYTASLDDLQTREGPADNTLLESVLSQVLEDMGDDREILMHLLVSLARLAAVATSLAAVVGADVTIDEFIDAIDPARLDPVKVRAIQAMIGNLWAHPGFA